MRQAPGRDAAPSRRFRPLRCRPNVARAMPAPASFRDRSSGKVAPAATRSPFTFHPTNCGDRRADQLRREPGIRTGTAAPAPPDRPLRPARRARGHLKRGFRRDVKVPATNEATNNPAGRARCSARGRHALASPCRTP
ncbi:hypothetical protein B9Z07_24055 [Burkholderia cenocepacia]|uniref:Uncharacterized protein n=1 Tax=Burkholderia cenocepacia TaxID=95486 RepID=A0AAD0NEM5_9BURK|nr:hypothetical protein B9Z07_24055 [Burkholderia cenocepacia]PRE38665.1 hypothetical protein C6P63_01480 [Burkholderia cenocepacia]